MRHLATIQTIDAINPIEGADKIVCATCLGWHVVVKKDEFKVGDKCLYIEIDSIVPKTNPIFEFLENRKYRVKTIKLKGQISQGLCLPVSLFPELKDFKVGDDVTKVLSIVKYDPELQIEKASSSKKKSFISKILSRYEWYRNLEKKFSSKNNIFPSQVISKSDEERIQAIPSVLRNNLHSLVSYTEKVDGQSYTATLEKKKFLKIFTYYKFTIASRNYSVSQTEKSNYVAVTEKYNIKKVLKDNIKDFDSIALQGEICGPGIQKNKYKLSVLHLYLFKIQFNKKDDTEILSQLAVKHFAEDNCLESVPFLGEFTLQQNIDQLVQLASSENSKLNPGVKREGIVIRQAHKNYGFSFKVINPEFLLKFDE